MLVKGATDNADIFQTYNNIEKLVSELFTNESFAFLLACVTVKFIKVFATGEIAQIYFKRVRR